MTTGTLYVVATPIGNVDDISERARRVLGEVSLIAAEDTRHTGRLLQRLGIDTPLQSCHEHNEAGRVPGLLAELAAGRDIALVSDAGTPLLSDPGFPLVRAAVEAGVAVTPVPGSSAITAALSVAGLPTDRFRFEGFLPATAAKRRARLASLGNETATLVFYESVHRIQATLADMVAAFGPDRPAAAARELTKLHETIYRGTLAEVGEQIAADPGGDKGEYTLVIGGAAEVEADTAELDRALGVLLGYLGVREAADIAAKLFGVRKNEAYKRALALRERTDNEF